MNEPIRKSILPTTPPPEWEFASVLGAPHGCALLPTDTGDVVVRRRVTYGDWEPVRPDHWADEPATVRGAARTASGQQPETEPAERCSQCRGSGLIATDPNDARTEIALCHHCHATGLDLDHSDCCPGCIAQAAVPVVGQPAEAQATDEEARPPVTSWTACRRGDTDWLVASSTFTDRDQALERLVKRRKEQPDAEFALVRETTTWTVEGETR